MEYLVIIVVVVFIAVIAYRSTQSSKQTKTNSPNQGQIKSKTLMDVLSEDDDTFVRQAVSWNRSTPSELLSKLALDPAEAVRIGVARNENTSEETLELLSKDTEVSVRRDVATNEHTPQYILVKLIEDDTPESTESTAPFAAQNPNTPPDALRNYVNRVLAQEEQKPENEKKFASYIGLWNEVSNPSMPQDVLEELLQICSTSDEHGAMSLKHGIARNPGASLRILDTLARDESSYVRYGLEQNPQAPQSALRTCYELYGVSSNLAENPNTPKDILEECSRAEDANIREAVARNESTSPDVLNMLANDSSEYVRATVAENPNTPQETLERLSYDESKAIRHSVAKNPSITRAIATELFADTEEVHEGLALNPSTPKEILDKLAKAVDEYIRIYVASNKNTAAETLEEMISSPTAPLYTRIVIAIGENPNTPPRLLRFLSGNPDRFIREAIARNPKISEIQV